MKNTLEELLKIAKEKGYQIEGTLTYEKGRKKGQKWKRYRIKKITNVFGAEFTFTGSSGNTALREMLMKPLSSKSVKSRQKNAKKGARTKAKRAKKKDTLTKAEKKELERINRLRRKEEKLTGKSTGRVKRKSARAFKKREGANRFREYLKNIEEKSKGYSYASYVGQISNYWIKNFPKSAGIIRSAVFARGGRWYYRGDKRVNDAKLQRLLEYFYDSMKESAKIKNDMERKRFLAIKDERGISIAENCIVHK